MRKLVLISAFLLVIACSDFNDKTLQKSLLKRVSFDFDCPVEALQLTELSRSHGGYVNSYAVTGCAQKGVYTRPLENTYWSIDK